MSAVGFVCDKAHTKCGPLCVLLQEIKMKIYNIIRDLDILNIPKPLIKDMASQTIIDITTF